MYSSSPQTCNNYYSSNNSNSSKHETSGYQSLGRCTLDNTSHSNAPHNVTSDLPPSSNSSWNPHLEHDYSLESPTPATSLSFQLPQQSHYSGIMTPLTSTPYVLSHPSSHHHHQQDSLVTPTTPTTPSSLPSYGYGLSHRGFLPRPKLTTTLWEDERTVCFQVDANGICVARREDNDMINGTKLLNVAGMSRGKRDGILKNEKGRVVVKVGAMHLKGVWITFDRAKTLSAQFKIQDILYPLFVDNPQTFLYSHPMTSPISRLGSFRPFYPPSWDRTLPSSSATTPTSPSTPVSLNHHHHHHHHHHSPPYGSGSSPPPSSSPSDSPYDTATTKTTTAASVTTSSATFGYRPGGPLFTPPTSSYKGDVNSDANTGHHDSTVLSMDYRSEDGLAHQVPPSSPPPTSHGPSSSSSYYNDLLDSNHRSNDMTFYNSNTTETSSKGSEKLGPAPISHPHHSSLLDDHNSLLDGKRPTGAALQSSAFQSLDTTAFHHPQPVYMDSNTGRDGYPSVPLYLDTPVKGMAASSSSMVNYSDHSSSSSRREVMNPRNGMIQRHHPYANAPKLSNDPNFSTLKKPSTSRLGGSRFLTKEIDDPSVKTDADHRPW